MDFYLIPSKGDAFRFPVNPSSVDVSIGKQIDTVDLNDIGEYDIPVGEKRTVYQFSSFFPAYYDSYCQYQDIPHPDYALKQLIKMKELGEPVRLLITESPFNELVTLVNIDPQIKGGEVGDLYFSIELRAHLEIKVRKTTRKLAQQKKSRPSSKPKSKTYTVVKGDNLWDIAEDKLSSGSDWKSIYNIPENKKTIGSNPDLIYPGQKLVLPS